MGNFVWLEDIGSVLLNMNKQQPQKERNEQNGNPIKTRSMLAYYNSKCIDTDLSSRIYMD